MTRLKSIRCAYLLMLMIDFGNCFVPASLCQTVTPALLHRRESTPANKFVTADGRSSTSSSRSSSALCMVRNIDLAEAIIFYGKHSLFQDEGELMAGVENLVDECIRDETAVLAILPDSCRDSLSVVPNEITIHREEQTPPNPRDLWAAIHSVQVQPKGFGGSSGFGRKAADPERPPLPRHCVVLCHTEDQCRAARFAGMRVLCLIDNDLADGIMFDDCWESICMDDIATPGSFWLNPPHPKDDEGKAVDAEQIMHFYESGGSEIEGGSQMGNKQAAEGGSVDSEVASQELDDEQLAAMLADIDGL